jgi:hypothetical protein
MLILQLLFQDCSTVIVRTERCRSTGACFSPPSDSMWDSWWMKYRWSKSYFFLRVPSFYRANHSTISSYSSITSPLVCDSSDQAAHYHILGLHIYHLISPSALAFFQRKKCDLLTMYRKAHWRWHYGTERYTSLCATRKTLRPSFQFANLQDSGS